MILFGQNGFINMLGIGSPAGQRGEQLRVKGWTILGAAGQRGGALTFMPPDGTGFYSIDNPGNQRLRISGGSVPGQYEYVVIQHPGHIRINGNLQVNGAIRVASGRPYVMGAQGHGMSRLSHIKGSGKADSHSWYALQTKIEELRAMVIELTDRINKLQ